MRRARLATIVLTIIGVAVMLFLVAVIGLITGSFVFLHRFFSDKFYDRTGRAQWLWQEHRFASRDPVAFFAARTFLTFVRFLPMFPRLNR